MQTLVLKIAGMTCQGCVRAVTAALEDVAGVSQVAVSLEETSATLHYDETKVSPETMMAAVDDAGFDVLAG